MTDLQRIRLEHTEETRERRKAQAARVYELKICESNLSNVDKERLRLLFIDAKRVVNDIIATTNQSLFKYNYKDHKAVQVKFPDGHLEERNINLPSAMHQDICQSKMQDVKTLHASKMKRRDDNFQ
jgi:hypothetical protein